MSLKAGYGYGKVLMQLKALGDIKRLEILEKISGGEKCACVLLEDLNLTQSGLSYHMKLLKDAGLVSARQDGKWTHYSISEDFGKEIIFYLESMKERNNQKNDV